MCTKVQKFVAMCGVHGCGVVYNVVYRLHGCRKSNVISTGAELRGLIREHGICVCRFK